MRQPHHPDPDPPLPGQESVWDYPRPPICEPTSRHIRIVHRDMVIADTRGAWRTLETSHPPTYYIPQSDIAMAHLRPNRSRSICEWKGQAVYWDVVIGKCGREGGPFRNRKQAKTVVNLLCVPQWCVE